MRPTQNRSTPKFLKHLPILTFFLIITVSPCYAVDLTFQWSPNPESDQVVGYKIYYKTGFSGPPYDGNDAIEGDSPINVTGQELGHPLYPEFTIRGLYDNETYFFAITAYDVNGFESDYSDELCYNSSDDGCPELPASSARVSPSNDSEKSGCFIATAAFGSAFEPHVKILKKFRDRFLLPNKIGKKFVILYYKHSPPLSETIKNHEILKAAVRWGLLPVVGMSWVALKFGMLPIFLFMCFSVIGLAGGLVLIRRQKGQSTASDK